MAKVQWFIVAEDDVGLRLDLFLSQQVSGINRSIAQKLIDSDKIEVNNKREKPSYKLHENDVIGVAFSVAELSDIPEVELPVLYEDNDCIVINKPVGLLTHSKGAFNPEATVASFIKSRIDFSGDSNRDGIVHRLDRATSGVIICAKNQEALSWLQKQFSARKAKKTYIAVVSGRLKEPEAIIDMPIERNPKDPKTFRSGPNGKHAVTHYKVLQQSDEYCLVELQPTTGRTHQLRVHLATIGEAIVGDQLYGGKPYERLLLHAHKLEITLPNKSRKIFTAPVPPEFTAIMK